MSFDITSKTMVDEHGELKFEVHAWWGHLELLGHTARPVEGGGLELGARWRERDGDGHCLREFVSWPGLVVHF